MQPMRTVRLEHATDLAGFRHAARTLVQAGIQPTEVHWAVAASLPTRTGDAPGGPDAGGTPGFCGGTDLFDTGAAQPGAQGLLDGLVALTALHPAPAVPRSFIADCERLVLHRDPDALR